MVIVRVHDLAKGCFWDGLDAEGLRGMTGIWVDVRPGDGIDFESALAMLREVYDIPADQVEDILNPPADIFPRIDHTRNMYCRLRTVCSTDLVQGHAHFLLLPGVLITHFSDALSSVKDAAANCAAARRDPFTMFAALVCEVVTAVAPVLTNIDTQIAVFEQRVFNATRQNVRADMEQSMQLHSIKRVLGSISQGCTLTHRCVKTIVAHIKEPGGVDAFEEVLNVSTTILNRVDALGTAVSELDTLMFNLSAYRSSVVQQVLTGVSVLFVPLTWWAGIYGTNFHILPELAWGVDDADDVQPSGWAAGYMYFWLVMVLMCVISVAVMRAANVF